MQFGRIWIDQQDNAAAARRVFYSMGEPSAGAREGALAWNEAEQPRASGLAMPPCVGPELLSLRFEGVGFRYPDGRRALADVNFLGMHRSDLGDRRAERGGQDHAGSDDPQVLESYRGPGHPQRRRPGRHGHGDPFGVVSPTSSRNTNCSPTPSRRTCASRAPKPPSPRWSPPAGLRVPWTSSEPCPMDSSRGSGAAAARCRPARRQRLSIARGLLRGAPILILDEPTAALDPDTERALLDALSVSGKGRLTIVIAHRLSTIERADRIVYLDRGRVVETGTHDELMAKPNGAYRRFVGLQVGGNAALRIPREVLGWACARNVRDTHLPSR